jgi:uncharacterized membrane protein
VDFRKLCRIACVFLLIFFSQGDALAATIHGTVYEWNSFKPLNNTVIDVNSTPEQYYVATDANYSFNLTPGTYFITANYFEGNTLVYTAKETVVISGEGEYVHDLLLFPPYEEELLSQNGSDVPDLNSDAAKPVSPSNPENYYLVAALLAFVVVTLLGIYLLIHLSKKKNQKPPEIITGFSGENGFSGRKENLKRLEAGNLLKEAEFSEETEDSSAKNSAENPDDSKENLDDSKEYFDDSKENLDDSKENLDDSAEDLDDGFEIQSKLPASTGVDVGESEDRNTNLPDDLKELLELIRANGNRITQRELRKKSPYSESKVSLMLSDLEERGLIEKFKRGRGNIIRIPDEHISKQTEDESIQE